jgi:predicted dehydrogenase
VSGLATRSVRGANEKVVIGVMGLGGRGTFLTERFAQRKDVVVAYLCDPDSRRFARARNVVEEEQDKAPKTLQDFRKMLEDKSVDAVVNATPDHWHALGSILACQAGKDVYVEKPMSYNVWEGRKMVEAARKYQRVVTVGTQSRSAPYVQKAVDCIKAGKLGDVHLVRVFNMMQHSPSKPVAEQPVPQGFDYDMWCGPAAKPSYNPSRRWLNQYEYSCGPIAGDAVHQMDLARMLMGDIPAPKTVQATGAIYHLKDGRDTPDTQLAAFEYDGCALQFEATLWTPYMKKIAQNIREGDLFPNWPFCATRVEVYGTKGFMFFGRHGGGWQVFDPNCDVTEFAYGRPGDTPHIENFVQCIRSRQKPNADVEQGHYSALVCHLANIAGRVGNKTLVFDAKTETFAGAPEANRLLKRASYREPWIVPDKV